MIWGVSIRVWAGDGRSGWRVLGSCAKVLDGPTGGVAECGCGVDGPVGVAQEFASEKDEVGLTLFDDGVGLCGVCDEADRGGGDCGFASDSSGKGDLKAGADGNLGVGDLAAGGNVDQVDAVFLEET